LHRNDFGPAASYRFLLGSTFSLKNILSIPGLLVFSFFLLFLSAVGANGEPRSQDSFLRPTSHGKTQSCANGFAIAIPSPLLVSARLAFYSPSALESCSNPGHGLYLQSPADTAQKQADVANPNRIPKAVSYEHVFWDRENGLLFAAVGASRTLDYFSTLNFRRRGRNEALLTNEIVDNHAAFASIEAAATVASIGVSYLFHRYHHHRLERWTSIIHAGLATSGAIRNYCLKTAHP
jgi:hypothetical protein